ncbi:uncharacterized mitochondrial protein-like protein [Tanacetum coccineum]|uniref:Uncharacterized mitochondrial protein-like protein n=1 Tax=Tanacetum coccineum TaxID=301880 RepID=A0ABQ4ZC99_9ASTR
MDYIKLLELDDIIFGSTKKELCIEFKKLMHEKFQMSSMGELTFFLGLQVQQKKDDIFISQDKYVGEILKKFGFTEVKTASTPMETQKPLLKDEDGEEVDVHMYRYQVNPKVSHLHAVKRIFRLISWQCKKQTVVANSITEGEYVAASSCSGQLQALVDGKKIIVTEAFVRSDLQLDDEEGMDCLPNATIFEELTRMGFVQVFLEKQLEGMSNHNRIHVAPSHTKKIFGNMKRVGKGFSGRVTPLFPTMVVQAQEEMGEDEVINEEMDDSLVRAATTASSLEAEQDIGSYEHYKSLLAEVEHLEPGFELQGAKMVEMGRFGIIREQRIAAYKGYRGGVLRSRGGRIARWKVFRGVWVSRLENGQQGGDVAFLVTKGGKIFMLADRMVIDRLRELIYFSYVDENSWVVILYKVGLSRRVKSSNEEGLGEDDASKRERIADIDADAGINLVSTHFDADTDMFRVHDLVGDEVVVDSKVAIKAASTILVSAATTTTTVITDNEITLAKALAELKSAKLPTTTAATTITAASTRPKAKGIVIHEQEQAPTPTGASTYTNSFFTTTITT